MILTRKAEALGLQPASTPIFLHSAWIGMGLNPDVRG